MSNETQNKFWLVWSQHGGDFQYKHKTQELAIAEAKKLAKEHAYKDVFVMEATHNFKADVSVVGTDLTKSNKSSEVVQKSNFAIHDLVLFDNTLYYIINSDNIYIEIRPMHINVDDSITVFIRDVTRVENPRTVQEYWDKVKSLVNL